MAERTPRFSYLNLLAAIATKITPSSEVVTLPAAFLRDPLTSKRWRSAPGWTIKAGFNDKLDFKEDANARVATLAAGNYLSGADIATQVQGAMNAAPGAVNTYTATYSASTNKVTIARATGTAAVQLNWATGPNAAASVGKDIGFDVSADDTGSTSYTGDNPCFQGRHYVVFDLGSAQSLAVFAAVGHNLAAAGTIRGQGHSSDAWGAPNVDQLLGGSGSDMRAAWFAASSQRYWRALIDNVGQAAGYSELGVAWGGAIFQPGRSIDQGFNDDESDFSAVTLGDQGAIFQSQRSSPRRLKGELARLATADRDSVRAMLNTVGLGGHLLFGTDPQNQPSAESLYGAFVAASGFVHAPADQYSFPFEFLEELQ